jgi:hypothetical protein
MAMSAARYFTEDDWNVYVGAEPFADARHPAIRVFDDLVVIADGQGVAAYDEHGGWYEPAINRPQFKTGRDALRYLNALTAEEVYDFDKKN